MCQVAGIGKTGKDVLPAKARIVGEEFLLRLACGELFEDELDGKTRSADHGFSSQDLGVHGNALERRHGFSLACERQFGNRLRRSSQFSSGNGLPSFAVGRLLWLVAGR